MTKDQWERLQSLLRPQEPHTGRPAEDHRRIMNGILRVLRTGAPCADLPEGCGPSAMVDTRFYRWRKAGIWDRIMEAVRQQADAKGQIDWEVHYVDPRLCGPTSAPLGRKRGLTGQ